MIMSENNICAVEVFKDLFSHGAKAYQLAIKQGELPDKYLTSLRTFRAEKLRAQRVMEGAGNQQHFLPLPQSCHLALNEVLQGYGKVRQLKTFIDIEKRLVNVLHSQLNRLTPSQLSLDLRKIVARHQQCIEILSTELATDNT